MFTSELGRGAALWCRRPAKKRTPSSCRQHKKKKKTVNTNRPETSDHECVSPGSFDKTHLRPHRNMLLILTAIVRIQIYIVNTRMDNLHVNRSAMNDVETVARPSKRTRYVSQCPVPCRRNDD